MLRQLVTDRYQFHLVTNCNPLTNAAWTSALVLLAPLLFIACQSPAPPKAIEPREIHTADYDLLIPAQQDLSRPSGKALLVLFPCFGCDAADTRSESKIAATAAANGIAVLMMDFNRHLLMSDAEKEQVIGTIEEAVRTHGLDARHTVIGGFSSGGNVSVLLAKELLNAPRPGIA